MSKFTDDGEYLATMQVRNNVNDLQEGYEILVGTVRAGFSRGGYRDRDIESAFRTIDAMSKILDNLKENLNKTKNEFSQRTRISDDYGEI